ncbi:MAG: hypothetical protein R3B74_15715 [Nitrospirales bacterium]|nr:hypothetical protein [Nitrospirales bacterium]
MERPLLLPSSGFTRGNESTTWIASYPIQWPIKVTPGEEAVWISLVVSLGMVMLTILCLWCWPDLLRT